MIARPLHTANTRKRGAFFRQCFGCGSGLFDGEFDDVVAAVQDACEKAGVAHPTIVSESGRAVAAHQSVLVFDALGVDHLGFGKPEEPPEGCHRVIREMYDTWLGIQPKNVQEAWHDAQTALEESRQIEILRKLATLAQEMLEDPAEAGRAYQRILEVQPEYDLARNRLEQIYEETQRWAELVELLRDRIERTQESQVRNAIHSRIAGSELRRYEGGHLFVYQDRQAFPDVIEFLAG